MSSSMVSRIRASSKVRNISKSSCFICIDASDAGDYIAARCHNSFLAMRVSLVIDNLLIHRHGLSRLHLYKSDFGSATPASSFVSVHPSAFLLASAAAAHTAIASSSLIASMIFVCTCHQDADELWIDVFVLVCFRVYRRVEDGYGGFRR